jgi:acid phosphatase family membrane protein YuiD
LGFADTVAEGSTLRSDSIRMATINDLVLKTAVGVRLEAGVDIADVRRLIEQFAAAEASSHDGDGFVGFLGVEDIAPDRRDQFLAALADLSAPSDNAAIATALGLQQEIDRLHAARHAAVEADAGEQAQALLTQIEQLQEERRQMLHRIGKAVPWGGKPSAA